MAKIIEEVEDEIVEVPAPELAVESDIEDTTLEAELKPMPEEKPKEEVQTEEDILPEKYKGKSTQEIVAMHQEAEKLIGKQGSEVGELRKVVDDFVQSQIDSHPAIKEAQQAAQEMKRTATLTRLNAEFPELEQMVQDPAFAEWIKSSRVRSELYNRAEVHFDYDSGHELLSNWKEKQERIAKVTETNKIDKDNQLKAANVGSKGNNEPVSKKKYRRSDIIKLMQTDPDKYDALSDEIMQAYQEGRVI